MGPAGLRSLCNPVLPLNSTYQPEGLFLGFPHHFFLVHGQYPSAFHTHFPVNDYRVHISRMSSSAARKKSCRGQRWGRLKSARIGSAFIRALRSPTSEQAQNLCPAGVITSASRKAATGLRLPPLGRERCHLLNISRLLLLAARRTDRSPGQQACPGAIRCQLHVAFGQCATPPLPGFQFPLRIQIHRHWPARQLKDRSCRGDGPGSDS